MREDIRAGDEDCSPRRTDLPPGATDGVECRLDEGPAERVGAYLFPDDPAATSAYTVRLAEYGVDPSDQRVCRYGVSPVPIVDDAAPSAACFVNEFDRANLRMVWPGQSVLVGALGRTRSTEDLALWARGRGDRRSIDVWEGALGPASQFDPCPDAGRPPRIRAPLTLLQGEGQLTVSDPDGRNRRRIDRADGFLPEWSPDGRLIAYTVESAIWLVDPDRGRPRPLVRTGSPGYGYMGWPRLAWSPDGRRIAYTDWTASLDADGNERLRPSVSVVDVDTGSSSKIGDGALIEWAPDSSRLLVRIEVEREFDMHGPIAVAPIDGGAWAQIGVGGTAAWSPDCRFVALASGYEPGSVVVHDGVARRPVIAIDGSSSDWSPATGSLAVGTNAGELWMVPMDGEPPHRLTSGGGPVWSEDGSMLAYETAEGLTVARADGSDPTVVASDRYPLTGGVAWSSDGQYLVSSSEPMTDTCGPPQFGWVIATDGSGVRSLGDPYHARWRPIDASPPPVAELDDPPPKRGEGCGG